YRVHVAGGSGGEHWHSTARARTRGECHRCAGKEGYDRRGRSAGPHPRFPRLDTQAEEPLRRGPRGHGCGKGPAKHTSRAQTPVQTRRPAMSFRIPLAKPEIADADRDAVTEVLRTPWLSSGPKVEQFERAVCQYTGAKDAVAVNSGTSALQLAIRVLGIERGAEVVLPSFTFSALLNVLLLDELRPRLVAIDP